MSDGVDRLWFVARPAVLTRLLLSEFVGPEQNSPARSSRPTTQLRLRETRSEGSRLSDARWSRKARGMPTFSGCEMLGRATAHREE